MSLSLVFKEGGKFKKRKIVGRGIASGKGKTSGRGHKGQKSRSGVAIKGFEGGQMPIHRRIPKRGFTNIFAQKYSIINLNEIQSLIDDKKIDPKKEINIDSLKEAGYLKKSSEVIKLLSKGEINSSINVKFNYISKSARQKIEKLKGSVAIIGGEESGDKE